MNERWKCRYLDLARQVSTWSKDPSTKVGAVVVGAKGQVLCQGYNGFPRGVDDSPERLADRPTKYRYTVHAEKNAIYNATMNGVSLDGATLFVVGLPVCEECAKAIVQVGIKEVVVPVQDVPAAWHDSCQFAADLFKEVGITYTEEKSFQ